MVDVGHKTPTQRTHEPRRACACCPRRDALRNATLPKGDAFVAAQIAGIMAAKQRRR